MAMVWKNDNNEAGGGRPSLIEKMTLADELGKKFAEAYLFQNECGANYLSTLIWDAWRGLPVNPNDPVPYVQTLLGGKISLNADKRITRLSKAKQEQLYEEAGKKMWEYLKEQN